MEHLTVEIGWVALAAFVVAVLYSLLAIGKSSLRDTSSRLLGTFLVVALAIWADNGGIYALAIVIIASFITELEFLENIFALFTKQEAFWKYRIALTKASPSETKRKLVQEAESEGGGRLRGVAASEAVARAREFEDAVFGALMALPEFESAELRRNLSIRIGHPRSGAGFILDGVVVKRDVHYVVEVKLSRTPEAGLHQLIALTTRYEDLLRAKGERALVKGILIAPDGMVSTKVWADNLATLAFDARSERLLEVEELKEWLD